MALPNDEDIQYSLLFLLEQQRDGAMHCQDVYRVLAERFPGLSYEELSVPYSSSASHWANRVQWAAAHLKEQGLLSHHTLAGGRGVWALAPSGKEWLASLPDADKELEEMRKS